MDKALKPGEMELSTKVSGKTTKLMEMASSLMKMEIHMKASGRTIKLTDLECILM